MAQKRTLYTCTSISELPSNISTMLLQIKAFSYFILFCDYVEAIYLLNHICMYTRTLTIYFSQDVRDTNLNIKLFQGCNRICLNYDKR